MTAVGKWIEDLSRATLVSETDVRTQVAVPLLGFLGYPAENRAEEFNIYGFEGGTPLTAKPADIVLFDSPEHAAYRAKEARGWVAEHALVVVELKKPGVSLDGAQGQAQFYSHWAKAPVYVTSDGDEVRVFRRQPFSDDVEEISCAVAEIPERWDRFEALLGYEGVKRYCEENRLRSPYIERTGKAGAGLDEGGSRRLRKAGGPPAVAQVYRDWLVETTSRFHVPGATVSLPIDRAWAELEAFRDTEEQDSGGGNPEKGRRRPPTLEEQVTSYRESSRLGLRDRMARSENAFSADELPLAGDRLVVVAGPGAGKSTLQQRLANRLARGGANVARLRLPVLADRMRDGATFGEAVLDLGASDAGLERSELEPTLGNPDYLLADGLDECGALRGTVIEGLTSWAAGRPGTRVVVSTRPVGYDPALLPGWRHLELLPFDAEAARSHAGNVLFEMPAPAAGAAGAAEERLEAFMRAVEESGAARRVAGNPLLLGFLVLLFADGIPFGSRRAELYGKIVRQVRDREPRHASGPTADPEVAACALEILAWRLQLEAVLSRDAAAAVLGRELESELDVPPLSARTEARRCLEFWEERGLLERLSSGSHEALVFAHAGLGEYAAARHASGMGAEGLARWVAEVRRDPRWREVLLLAAGAGAARDVVGTLLDLYDPSDPVGEELELAAHALAEVPAPPEDLAERVAGELRGRLDGDIPAAVFDAAEATLGLAREAPGVVARAVRPLLRSGRFATRVAAVRVLLECGPEHADPDAVRGMIGELSEPKEGERDLPQRRSPFFVWKVQDQIAYLGAKQLLALRPGPQTEALVERMLDEDGLMGEGSLTDLEVFLLGEGHEDLVERVESKRERKRFVSRSDMAEAVVAANRQDIAEDTAFLEIVLAASGGSDDAGELRPSEARALGALMRGMEVGKYTPGDWMHMVFGDDKEAAQAVVGGVAAALGLEAGQLAREAAGVSAHLEGVDPSSGNSASGTYFPLLGTLPKVPVDPRWSGTAATGTRTEDLVRALGHPSRAVAFNAALLLSRGAGAPEAASLVADALTGVLHDASEHTYSAVNYLAPRLWGDREAVEHLVSALRNGITPTNYVLLIGLAELKASGDDPRAADAFMAGLRHDDPEVATELATEMGKPGATEVPLFGAVRPRLPGVLEHWTKRGTACRTHGGTIHGDRCPRCNNVPKSPRAALVGILGRAGMLDLPELIAMCDDPRDDVKRSATEQAAAAAARAGRLSDIVRGVGAGDVPASTLREVLALPAEDLRPAKTAIVDLFSSADATDEAREQILGAMAVPGWIDRAEATGLAREALDGQSLAVKDRARDTLRTLQVNGVSDRGPG